MRIHTYIQEALRQRQGWTNEDLLYIRQSVVHNFSYQNRLLARCAPSVRSPKPATHWHLKGFAIYIKAINIWTQIWDSSQFVWTGVWLKPEAPGVTWLRNYRASSIENVIYFFIYIYEAAATVPHIHTDHAGPALSTTTADVREAGSFCSSLCSEGH